MIGRAISDEQHARALRGRRIAPDGAATMPLRCGWLGFYLSGGARAGNGAMYVVDVRRRGNTWGRREEGMFRKILVGLEGSEASW